MLPLRLSTTPWARRLLPCIPRNPNCGPEKKRGANIETATKVGKLIAERGASKKVKQVVFDRGGNKYHGKVKALAEAAREGGLEF